MDFESKIISREVSQLLWEMEKTVSTAESCTGGRIAEAIIAVPGASKYFKGGIISYVDEVKESLLAAKYCRRRRPSARKSQWQWSVEPVGR